MATRLDRLIALLDTGSNPAIRHAAAKQVGELAKYYPDENHSLIQRVGTLLSSKSWETRVAASQALGAIASHVTPYKPEEHIEEVQKEQSAQTEIVADLKLFSNFYIRQLLEQGTKLLASGGNEFEDDDSGDIDSEINYASLTHDNMLFDELASPTKKGKGGKKAASAATPPTPTPEDGGPKGSARQKYMMKRKAKSISKDKKKGSPTEAPAADASTPPAKRMKTLVTEQPQNTQKLVIESVAEKGVLLMDRWIFFYIAEQLKKNLMDPAWEIRHGAALGLREILKYQASSAGKTAYSAGNKEAQEKQNQEYLEDICIRLISVFALDRFADFVSDQAIAPVRETSAQTLGTVLQAVNQKTVSNVVLNLIHLVNCQEWQDKLGGLLGLKYTVAIRQDAVGEMLPTLLTVILPSLDDTIDDVRAVAADTLYPIAESVVNKTPNVLKSIHKTLWNILLDLDDLSAATSSVMQLLAKFYSLTGGSEGMQNQGTQIFFSTELASLVPRLWPFFRHNLAAVRKSAVETLERLIGGPNCQSWILKILPETLRYVFQNIILETKEHVVNISLRVWELIMTKLPAQTVMQTANKFLASWITLLATPIATPFDINLLLLPETIKSALQAKKGGIEQSSAQSKAAGKKKRGRPKRGAAAEEEPVAAVPAAQPEQESKTFSLRLSVDDPEEYIGMKIAGSRAIGTLVARCYAQNPNIDLNELVKILSTLISSSWAVHRQLAGILLQELRVCSGEKQVLVPGALLEAVLQVVTDHNAVYTEIQQLYTQYINDMTTLLQFYMSCNIDVQPYISNQSVSFENAAILTSTVFDSTVQMLGENQQAIQDLTNRKKRVQTIVETYQTQVHATHISVVGSLACAIVANNIIPQNIENIVTILMNAVQKEKKSLTLQGRYANALADLMSQCAARVPCPNEMIIHGVCNHLCNTIPTVDTNSLSSAIDNSADAVITEAQVIQRGMRMVLISVAEKLGPNLFTSAPILWKLSGEVIMMWSEHQVLPDKAVVDALYLLKTISPSLNPALHTFIEKLLGERLIYVITDPRDLVRFHASQTIAVLCKYMTKGAMKIVYEKLLPMLADPLNVASRRGSVMTLYRIINTLEMDILPYIVLFVVPLLKRMSDQDDTTREIASNCFGNVIKILPLERSVASPEGFDKVREHERKFLEQLLDNSKVEPFEIPIKINAELRQYQKDGVSWLNFLNKFNLHGILCDDMGLGKTLQTICMVTSDIEIRKKMYEETRSPEYTHLPSLIVCPPTLVGHWFYEIKKFTPQITCVQYVGNPQVRKQIRDQIKKYDIVIMSYDILRNDIDNICAMDSSNIASFNYCVLDEGHIIKNAKTKITKAVKMVRANHRLVLSGTPIQNNVLELWSLFDFLMPGFLGTEKEFNQRYSKPILASKDAKANSKEQESAALALESLHRQVLPFLLRRVKEDVLHDLPEKIIQDYYCELCPLQARLYEDFSKNHLGEDMSDDIGQVVDASGGGGEEKKKQGGEKTGAKWHVFQALQYLRKLCNHPLLVLNENHPEYNKISAELKHQGKDIHDISYSPKLQALKELLQQCGIGNKNSKNSGSTSPTGAAADLSIEETAPGHRVLIFAQLKSMLDLIEKDLFKKLMPDVTYMRLDGGVDSSKRHSLVHKFNSDPTIDVLLLTTHVGGLGLNLTGADTVIFVEHDWNPSADLQAMDRAHRIGQKRVVNVYRLITKNTLEEKIMGLQRFKMNISKTVVNKENSSLKTMDTEQLIDLFKLGDQNNGASASSSGNSSASGSASATPPKGKMASMLQEVGELWDAEKQYEDFNLDSFLKNMKK